MAGKSDEQKQHLSDTITKGLIDILGYGEEAVSVAFEEVAPSDWTKQVYGPDFLGSGGSSSRSRGYGARPASSKETPDSRH
jgi:4-oxalocrotonate tautomerase